LRRRLGFGFLGYLGSPVDRPRLVFPEHDGKPFNTEFGNLYLALQKWQYVQLKLDNFHSEKIAFFKILGIGDPQAFKGKNGLQRGSNQDFIVDFDSAPQGQRGRRLDRAFVVGQIDWNSNNRQQKNDQQQTGDQAPQDIKYPTDWFGNGHDSGSLSSRFGNLLK
jgi:hypothetical protein